MRSLKLFSLAFFTYLLLTVYANVFLKDELYAVELDMSRIWVASLIAVTFFVLLVLGYLKPVEFPAWVYWLILFVLSFALPIYGTLAVAFVFLFSRKRNLRFELSRTLVFLAFLSGVSLVYVDWDSGFKTLVFFDS